MPRANKIWFAIAMLLALGGGSWAQPQQPSPQSSQQQRTQDERGSDKSPVVVKVLPAEKSKDEIDREKASQEAERQLVNLTGDLARYTKLLFIATGLLGIITAGLVAVGFFQVRDAKASIAVSVKAAKAAEKSAKVAESQFLVAHRPRLRVRHVTIIDAGVGIGHPTIFFEPGAVIEGALSVVNVGGTDARIIRSLYRIYFSKTGLPIRSPLDTSDLVLIEKHTILKVGESLVAVVRDKIAMEPDPDHGMIELRQFNREGWVIYVMGEIRFQDEEGNDRFMGFCRELQSDGRFRAVNDPDYEYED